MLTTQRKRFILKKLKQEGQIIAKQVWRVDRQKPRRVVEEFLAIVEAQVALDRELIGRLKGRSTRKRSP